MAVVRSRMTHVVTMTALMSLHVAHGSRQISLPNCGLYILEGHDFKSYRLHWHGIILSSKGSRSELEIRGTATDSLLEPFAADPPVYTVKWMRPEGEISEIHEFEFKLAGSGQYKNLKRVKIRTGSYTPVESETSERKQLLRFLRGKAAQDHGESSSTQAVHQPGESHRSFGEPINQIPHEGNARETADLRRQLKRYREKFRRSQQKLEPLLESQKEQIAAQKRTIVDLTRRINAFEDQQRALEDLRSQVRSLRRKHEDDETAWGIKRIRETEQLKYKIKQRARESVKYEYRKIRKGLREYFNSLLLSTDPKNENTVRKIRKYFRQWEKYEGL